MNPNKKNPRSRKGKTTTAEELIIGIKQKKSVTIEVIEFSNSTIQINLINNGFAVLELLGLFEQIQIDILPIKSKKIEFSESEAQVIK